MTCNVGGSERRFRFGSAAALAGASLLPGMKPIVRAVLISVAAINAITASVRYCPLNQALGRDSCHRTKQSV